MSNIGLVPIDPSLERVRVLHFRREIAKNYEIIHPGPDLAGMKLVEIEALDSFRWENTIFHSPVEY